MVKIQSTPDDPAWRRAEGEYPGWQIALSFLLGWLMIAAGVLGTLYAPVFAWRTHEFVRHAVHAQAPIVAFQTYPAGRGQTHDTYRPIVEVFGADGRPVRDIVGSASYPSPYQVGDRIDILYGANDPADAMQDTTSDIWGGPLALAVVSAFILLLGIGAVIWMRFFVTHAPEHLAWIDRWLIPLKLVTWNFASF